MHDSQPAPWREPAEFDGAAAIDELLDALCDLTGLGFAAVAEVSGNDWIARAVRDRMQVGIVTGQRLDVANTLCCETLKTRTAVVITHASIDPRYRDNPLPQRSGFESFISVPIFQGSVRYFGTLCAASRRPADVSEARIQLLFHCCAKLIGQEVEARMTPQPRCLAPLTRRVVANLKGLFLALLAQEPGPPAAASTPDPALRQLAAAAQLAHQPQRLGALINEVLAYAHGRLDGDMPGYIWKVDDLHARLKAVVADTIAANRDRTIVANIAFDRPVDCDPGLIQDLASTLLRHALAHGDPGGPVSFIVSTRDNELEIAVWNAGKNPGNMPAAPGLDTCAKIVRAHLGTLRVTSSPSEGTQLVACIPVARSLRLH